MPAPATGQQPAPASAAFEYWGFISYSHKDSRFVAALHKALERIPIPRQLQRAGDWPVPARLFPVFMDRQELPVSADLGSDIHQALSRSRSLVLVCSDDSAASQWVNAEVEYFCRASSAHRVVCVWLGGQGAAPPVPPALQLVRNQATVVDLRGRRLNCPALARVAAAMLRIDPRPIERACRRSAWTRRIALALLAATVAGGGGWLWHHRQAQARLAAREQYDIGLKNALAAFRLGERSMALAAAQPLTGNPNRDHRFNRLWAELHRERLVINAHEKRATAVDASPDGTLIASGGHDGVIRVWDARTGAKLHEFPRDQSTWRATATAVRFSGDGRRLMAAEGLRGVRVWAVPSWELVAEISRSAEDASLDRQGASVALVTTGGTELWSIQPLRKMLEISDPGRDLPLAVALSPAGDELVVTFRRKPEAMVCRARTGAEIRRLTGHREMIWSVRYSPDGKLILTGGHDRVAILWDAATGRRLRTFDLHTRPVLRASFSADAARIVTAGDDGKAFMWDTHRGNAFLVLMGHEGGVRDAVFMPGNTHVVTAGAEGRVCLWDVVPPAEAVE